MKRLLYLTSLLIAAVTASCSKSDKDSNTNPNNNNPDYTHVVTITDAGKTTTIKGQSPQYQYQDHSILCVVTRGSDSWGSNAGLIVFDSLNYEINLDVQADFGPANGIGTYHSQSGGVAGTYTEYFPGGQKYYIQSATITVEKIENYNDVTGTFILLLNNDNGQKTVTGTFYCDKATVS